MSKCHKVLSVQGVQIEIELENADSNCDVDPEGRQHQVAIDNARPNSIIVEMHSKSTGKKVVFSDSGRHEWESEEVIPKRRSNSSTTAYCCETAFPDDTDDSDKIKTRIICEDDLPIASSNDDILDHIEVDLP